MFEFFNTLSESKLIPSVTHLSKYSADELADIAVLYICGLYILFLDKKNKDFASNYAHKTIVYGGFKKWQSSGTDLYIAMYGLSASNVTLDNQGFSDKFKSTVPLGLPLLTKWLRDMGSGRMNAANHRTLFAKMDFNFKTTNSSIRAIRRLVMDWDNLDHHERSLAMTRLLQMIKNRAVKGEIITKLQQLAHKRDLELDGVCDIDSGKGCGEPEPITINATPAHKAKEKGPGFLLSVAAIAAGAAVATAMDRKKK